jgi:hypothetical protein
MPPWKSWNWHGRMNFDPDRFKVPIVNLNAHVIKIALYVEGGIRFFSGPFYGLKRVIQTLRDYSGNMTVFDVHLFDRWAAIPENSGGMTVNYNAKITDIGLNTHDFDELWLFGITPDGSLPQEEINEIHAFMDNGGGVLTTGDHANLGYYLSGSIKRVGKMRRYPAPPNASGQWYSTLRQGNTPGYQFNDQSDATGQPVTLPVLPGHANGIHPVMSNAMGGIQRFPDHQHEGEAITPSSYPVDEWPKSVYGIQPKVDIIAQGTVIDPSAPLEIRQRLLGLVAAYDGHRARKGIIRSDTYGRIIADSTWHHWFDINLDGFIPGLQEFNDIRDYIVNVALWLDRPRNRFIRWIRATHLALQMEPLVMHDLSRMSALELGTLMHKSLARHMPIASYRDDTFMVFQESHGLQLENMREAVAESEWFGAHFPLDALLIGSAAHALIAKGIISNKPDEDQRGFEERIDTVVKAIPELCAAALPDDPALLKARMRKERR